jgi:Flp pilus assembly protein TadG
MPTRKLPSQKRGFVILFFCLSSVALLPIVGLSIDVVLMYFIKARLVSAADAGALAGARALARGGNFDAQVAAATATSQKFFRANFPNGALLSDPAGPTLSINVVELEDRTRRVTLEATVNAPLYFMRFVNFTRSNTNVRAIGQTTRRDVNIMLVVDRTGSLENVGACGTVKAAVIDFVNNFAEGRDLVGLATFAVSSRVDLPLSNTNFKQNVYNVMTNVSCTGYTGGPQGLAVGHNEIKRINDPGVLNVVLFFTDGIPNTVTADWPIKKSNPSPPYYTSGFSACTNKADKTGAITEEPSGIWNYVAIGSPGARDPGTRVSGSSGCYYANGGSISNDVSHIPDYDEYGTLLATGWGGSISRNGTTHGSYNYPPVGRKLIFSGSNVVKAARNGVDNAAKDIRENPNLRTVVYSIGFGSDVEESLLMKAANDPRSAWYDSTRIAGLYLFAPTKDAIKQAFQRVASEILRFSM